MLIKKIVINFRNTNALKYKIGELHNVPYINTQENDNDLCRNLLLLWLLRFEIEYNIIAINGISGNEKIQMVKNLIKPAST